MGACCCGIPRVKTIAATDFFETFEHSLFLLHQSIRRSVETASDRNRVLISDDDYDSYFDYCSMAIQFLIAHHVGEDKFVFPFMAASSGENTLIEKEIEEHLELEVTIDNIKRAIRSARQDQLAKDEAVAYVQGQFEGIGAVLLGESGHLNREEMKFSAAHMRSWGISENSLRVVSEQLHSVIPDYLDRMDGLIFIMCHLTDKEKLFWDERIPCIVTKFKFPRRAKKNNRLWALAPYCRTSAGGECAWYQHKVVHEQSQWSKIKIG